MSWFRADRGGSGDFNQAPRGDALGRDLHSLAESLEPHIPFVRDLEVTLRREAARRTSRPTRRHTFARARHVWTRASSTARILATAFTILILAGGGLWASPGARAGAGRLACLIPGLGIRDCDPVALVMARPVTTTRDGITVTVTRLLSSEGGTWVRVEITDIPAAALTELPGGVRLALLDDAGTDLGPIRAPSGQGILPGGGVPGATFGYSVEGMFPALASGTRATTVQVAGVAPLNTWNIRVPVTPAGEATLAQPRPGGLPVTMHGITLQVVSVAADPSGLALQVSADADPATGVVQAIRRSSYPGDLNLRDDRGREYRERQPPPPASDSNAAGPLTSDVLFPPLPADAGSGILVVPFVKVREPGGEATVRIPIGSRPAGELIPLDLPVTVGTSTFRVTGATMVDDRGPKILLRVDLGDWHDGRKLVEPGWAEIAGQRAGGATRWTGDVMQAIELSIRPPGPVGDEVTITLREPIVAIRGPWELEVPLPGQR